MYDIDGSKKNDDDTKTPNPNLCFDNNYLLSKSNNYSLPINGGTNWSCLTDSNASGRVYNFTKTFDQNYATLTAGFCERNYIKLD
ncbi:MAG: hypothetical protein LBQ59_04075 [Candidatus Peribacteria bacterium]|nr:hypothetical protein [Candidatus Peribacteria bacterium]